MNSIDLIGMAVRNLLRRKLRTSLTVIGIIIGTISIVIMISLGIGMKQNLNNEISKMGNLNTINVRTSGQDGYQSTGGSSKNKLNDEAAAKIEKIQGVEAVSPIIEDNAKIISGRYMAYVQLVGIKPEAMKQFDFEIDKGRLLKNGDKLNIVFGSEIPFEFYNPNSRRNDNFNGNGNMADRKAKVNVMKDRMTMTLNMSYGEKRQSSDETADDSDVQNAVLFYKVKAAGTLKQGDYQKDYYVFMPIDEVKKLRQKEDKAEQQRQSSSTNGGINNSNSNTGNSSKKISYTKLMVKIKDIKKIKEIQTQIGNMGYQTESLNDMVESAQKQENIIQLVLGGIGAVALLVAAIGIANTMIMAIYERRKEIGVMKVIGASVKDIRTLFLLESAFIGLIGGAIGIVLCIIISNILNKVGGKIAGGMGPGTKISCIPYWLIILSVCFTTFVGIASGFLPARKATKLSALEAIKTE